MISALEKFGDIGQYGIPASIGGYALFTGHSIEALIMGSVGYLQGKAVFVIKQKFPRVRPEPYVRGKVSKEDTESFPSSHTGGAFLAVGLAYALYGISNPFTVIAATLASLVGLSRYLSKKHWFTDVLGGACIGFANGYLSVQCALLFKNRLQG